MTTMDKLDEFARAALIGILSDPSNREYYESTADIATAAYQVAEAMAAERERVLARRRTLARSEVRITRESKIPEPEKE